MNALIWWFLQCSVVAAFAIPIVAVACWFFRRRPAVQHMLWAVILLKFLTPSIIAWPWPILDVVDSACLRVPAWNDTADTSNVSAKVQRLPGNEASWIMYGWSSTGEASRVLAASSIALFTIWLIGGATLAMRKILCIRDQRRLLKDGTVASVALASVVRDVANRLGVSPPTTLMVKGISSPAVWCLGKPALLWPENMPYEDTTNVTRSLIAHELAHIHRRDHWMAWAQLMAGVMWWWNPLFWLVHRELTSTAELACDAVALRAYPQSRCGYAESLLTFAAPMSFPALALGARLGGASSLERRMSFIASELVDGSLSRSGVVLSALIAILIAPSWSLSGAHGGMSNRAVSSPEMDSAPDRVNLPAAQESRVSAMRMDMQRRARQKVLESEVIVEQAKMAHASANQRVHALAQLNDDSGRNPEDDEAIHILELTESDLEYAEAFHDLAEKQLNAVR
jgi:beta-lactamase regulating signal transducer with metallopeptidase domain